jgi:hypothetical protein
VLAIRAVDAAGNASAQSTELGFDADATVPTVAFSAPAADASVGRMVTFTFKASEAGVSYGCRLDREAMHACIGGQAGGPTVETLADGSVSVTYSGLPEGPHTFQVPRL